MRRALWALLPLLLAACAYRTDPVVLEKLEDLNRRVLFLRELAYASQGKGRKITPEWCAFFNGPEQSCAIDPKIEGKCNCQVLDHRGLLVVAPTPTPAPTPAPTPKP